MPELPDIVVYVEHLARRVVGKRLLRVRLGSPFVLRSVDPPLSELEGRKVVATHRIGKRVVVELEGDPPLFLVIHLMISGRFRWSPDPSAKIPGRIGLLACDFETGTLLLTEVSTKKRASLHAVRGREALAAFDRGGVEPLEVDLPTFRAALGRENHTLKRALTDPRLISGVGNAYSDEILHRARLSPVQLTSRLDDVGWQHLFTATQTMLREWTDRLRKETGDAWPEKVTAFREEMAVHGRHGKPCPDCGAPVQRIAYADNETNYCPRCQTGGRLLADRSLSRLMKSDWPKTLDELEELKAAVRKPPPTS